MNFVILSSVLSCGNSSMYVASRMLYAMGHSGKAPKFFSTLSRSGVPVFALLFTSAWAVCALFANYFGSDQRIYTLLVNASGLTGFIIWLGIAICHLRFRKAWVAQGRSLDDLKFKSKFYPYGPWIAVVLFIVVIFGANVGVFMTDKFSWFDFITDYLMIPLVIALYVGHKVWNKTRLVPLKECNFELE